MASVARQLAAMAGDIKLSHSVFALPFALLATFMAAEGWPRLGILLLIVICMVLARTTAMGANRVLDAGGDAGNPRTAGRALPAGRVSVGFYLLVMALCMAGFVGATAGFWWFYGNRWPVVLSLPVLVFLIGYPLMKRFTRLCHYYLGVALGLSPLCAWVAVAGTVAWEPIIMGLAVLFWSAGFDILYACQDFESDVKTWTFSVPARIGIARALWVSRLTHLLAAALLVLLWWKAPQLHWVFAGGLLVALALLIYEHSLVKANDLSRLNLAFFTMNGVISVILGVSGIIDVVSWQSA